MFELLFVHYRSGILPSYPLTLIQPEITDFRQSAGLEYLPLKTLSLSS